MEQAFCGLVYLAAGNVLDRFGNKAYNKYMMQTKNCPQCQQAKPLSGFSEIRSGKYDSWCRECRKTYNRVYHITYRKRSCPECGSLIGIDARYCRECRIHSKWNRKDAATEARQVIKTYKELFNPEPICSVCGVVIDRKSKGLCSRCYHKNQPQVSRQKKSESIRQLWLNGHYDDMLVQMHQNPTNLEIDLADTLDRLELKHTSYYRPDRCSYVYDEYIPELSLLIEVDGEHWHHSEWAEEQGVPEKDARKDQWAIDHGYRIIRVREHDSESKGMKTCLAEQLFEQLEF